MLVDFETGEGQGRLDWKSRRREVRRREMGGGGVLLFAFRAHVLFEMKYVRVPFSLSLVVLYMLLDSAVL